MDARRHPPRTPAARTIDQVDADLHLIAGALTTASDCGNVALYRELYTRRDDLLEERMDLQLLRDMASGAVPRADVRSGAPVSGVTTATP